MALATLNDFFSDGRDAEKRLFIHNGVVYEKGTITRLIAKYVKVAREFQEKECLLYAADGLLFIVGFFALLHSGKKVILASNIRENTVSRLKVRNLLTTERVTYDGATTHILDFSPPDDETEIPPFASNAEVAFFTSGSTGSPKEISRSFSSLYGELAAIDALFAEEPRPETVTLATVSLLHLYGMTFAFLFSLAKGFVLDTRLIETPEELSHKLQRYDNSFLVSSPAFLDRLAKYGGGYDFSAKPYLMTSSGGPLSRAGAEAARKMFGISPYEVFGSTETGVVGHRKQLERNDWELFPSVSAHCHEDGHIVVTSAFLDQKEFHMGDNVEFTSERSFQLKGRFDRMVKIEEKRVSFPEIEEVLASHEFVERAYGTTVTNRNGRTGIGVCICLNDTGKNFLAAAGRREILARLRRHAKGRLDNVAVPSRWRFVEEIPLNTQGKIIKDEIANILSSRLTEPVVLERNEAPKSLELHLVFPEGSHYFEGHFDDFPILPGVVQVHFALHFARRKWNGLLPDAAAVKVEKISKLKFSNLIRPAQKISLLIERNEKGIAFKYYDSGKTYSSGSIIIGDA